MHIGVDGSVQFHISQRIYLFDHTQIERTFCLSFEIGVADRCFHVRSQTERIPCQTEAERVDLDGGQVYISSRIPDVGTNVDLIDSCGQCRITEYSVLDLHVDVECGDSISLQRTFG